MIKRVFILILIIFSMSVLFARIQVRRDSAVLRSGPGSWYEVLEYLEKGTKLESLKYDFEEEESDQWIKVKYNEREGFISIVSTMDIPPKKDVFASMAQQTVSTEATRHGVSAGIKGFGERFTRTFKGDIDFLDFAMIYSFDSREYKRFKKDTYRGFPKRANYRRVRLPQIEKEFYFTESETGLGLGISSVIASQGLFFNKRMQDYINFLGMQLVEAFDLTDIDFKFFILNTSEPNAYATPGGIIFITRGMIDLCLDEAELSLVLAHEIAHVIYNHGMQEILKRKHHIAAEARFQELDNMFADSMSKKAQETNKELENDAFLILETLVQGRLDKYEKEADETAMIMTARAGYNPQNLITLLNRFKIQQSYSKNENFREEIINFRINWATEFLVKTNFPENLMDKKERFQIHKRMIK